MESGLDSVSFAVVKGNILSCWRSVAVRHRCTPILPWYIELAYRDAYFTLVVYTLLNCFMLIGHRTACMPCDTGATCSSRNEHRSNVWGNGRWYLFYLAKIAGNSKIALYVFFLFFFIDIFFRRQSPSLLPSLVNKILIVATQAAIIGNSGGCHVEIKTPQGQQNPQHQRTTHKVVFEVLANRGDWHILVCMISTLHCVNPSTSRPPSVYAWSLILEGYNLCGV